MASLPAMYRRFPDALSESYRSRAIIYLARDGTRLLSNSRIIPRGNALENTFLPHTDTSMNLTTAAARYSHSKVAMSSTKSKRLFVLRESHLL